MRSRPRSMRCAARTRSWAASRAGCPAPGLPAPRSRPAYSAAGAGGEGVGRQDARPRPGTAAPARARPSAPRCGGCKRQKAGALQAHARLAENPTSLRQERASRTPGGGRSGSGCRDSSGRKQQAGGRLRRVRQLRQAAPGGRRHARKGGVHRRRHHHHQGRRPAGTLIKNAYRRAGLKGRRLRRRRPQSCRPCRRRLPLAPRRAARRRSAPHATPHPIECSGNARGSCIGVRAHRAPAWKKPASGTAGQRTPGLSAAPPCAAARDGGRGGGSRRMEGRLAVGQAVQKAAPAQGRGAS